MQLKLKCAEKSANFVKWLDGFKDMDKDPSLLIEIDVDTKKFVAKSFPTDRFVIKYAEISFAEAGLECVGVYDNDGNAFDWNTREETASGRIMVGVYKILKKFISVASMFSSVEHEMTVSFDICNSVTYMTAQNIVKEYQGTDVTFKSLTLTMNVHCSVLSDFFLNCDDDTFHNKVCNIASPAVYEVSSDAIANLGKIASVFSSDEDRDCIKFYTKAVDGKMALYAYDLTNSAYDYLLGYHIEGSDDTCSINVLRKLFSNPLKTLSDEKLRFVLDTAGASRIMIDADKTKVIVSASINN